VIEELLPASVAAVEAFDDCVPGALFPEEEAVIAAAVDKRRREFTTVRLCARAALARIGVAPVPLLPGHRGAPGWPAGVVGSMTHCAGYRAAVVARAGELAAVGVDAEPNETLPDGVLPLVASDVEVAGLPPDGPVHWGRLLFSAKEAVYKAWYPLTGRWLDFAEASVTIDQNDGTFVARFLVPGPVVGGTRLDRFTGRWLARNGLVVAAVTVAAVTVAPAGRRSP
jgi:4'-phosphopantetheinyl transferase EntD